MTNHIPRWELLKYAILWKKFGTKEFTNEQAITVLKEKDRHILSVFFSDLNKAGWVRIDRDKNDKRKKIYVLKEPNTAIKELV